MTENRSRSPLAALTAASAAAILVLAACEAPRATAPVPEREVPVAGIVADMQRVEADSQLVVMPLRAQATAADTLVLLPGGTIMSGTLVLRRGEVRDSITALRFRGELSADGPAVALYSVDGVVVRSLDDLDGLGSITPERIESVEIMKGMAASRVYGPDAKGGVVSILLRDGALLPAQPAPPRGFQALPAPDTPSPVEVRALPMAPPAAPRVVSSPDLRAVPATSPGATPAAPPSARAVPAPPPGASAPERARVIPVPPAAPSANPPSAVIMESDGAVRLRASGSSQDGPLVIVDGVVLTNPDGLTSLVPDRIHSVEVLKGAAAVRIYGSRGANGVVVVTTKR